MGGWQLDLFKYWRNLLRAICGDANAYTNCNSERDSYANCNCHTNSDAHVHTSTITYTKGCSNIKAATDAASAPVTFDPIASNDCPYSDVSVVAREAIRFVRFLRR